MLDHDVKSIRPCIFTKLGPDSDVTAYDRLQPCADGGEDIPGTDHYSTHDTEVLRNPKVWQFEGGGYHLMRNRIAWRADGVRSTWFKWITIHVLPPGEKLSGK